MTVSKANKLITALEQFADSRSVDTLTLSQRMTGIPDELQEVIWELIVNYILATAERDKGWTSLMDVYVQQAKDIRKIL